ncbi:sporulation integral membrane protein YlbJ [Paenibacillus catalpae]|uniref:Sporulation integral membrane protein YlbJ n=1 Tax=Paenibacillus catalpae TaxID=1045775 RepID=A0A1I1UH82_9BACL|nr:nucleoside recognition domain-containing protein [Paenibacillus catalpae]SFD67290.1 sporulation integral membrane protein YlbJ [Paenibacillus catalpae]
MARTILYAAISILLVAAIIRQPDEAFQASLQGLTIWWNIVFPGLLPFLVLFELIAAFGLIHGIGVLLRPLMRTLFKLPGEAALPLLLGWMSGHQAGAEATAALRRDGLVSKREGQRLLALSHMPNPLFMLVVIGAGFLHRPELGLFIAAVVWLSALCTAGWNLLFNSRKDLSQNASLAATTASGGLFDRIADAINKSRERDGRSFGKALGDAVSSGVQKLLVVGGFMIFAAVAARLALPLIQFVLPSGAAELLLPALLESHIGAYAAAVWQGPGVSAAVSAAAVAAILAWSGISALLQAGYAITGTDLKLLPLIGVRLLHAVHAGALALLLWKPAQDILTLLPDRLTGVTAAMLQNGTEWQRPSNAYEAVTALGLPTLWPYTLTAAAVLAILFIIMRLAAPRTPDWKKH